MLYAIAGGVSAIKPIKDMGRVGWRDAYSGVTRTDGHLATDGVTFHFRAAPRRRGTQRIC